MSTGFIIDSYPDYQKNMMVTWLLCNNTRKRIEEPYHPTFYIQAPPAKRTELHTMLNQLPQIHRVRATKGKITLGSTKIQHLLEIQPLRFDAFNQLATMIDSWGGFHQYALFNVDLRLPTRYLQSRGVFCNARVHWDGTRFICTDHQWAIDYATPSFTSVRLRVNPFEKQPLLLTKPITGFSIDDTYIQEDNEYDTLLATAAYIKKQDPDIIYTTNGDGQLFPYVYQRAHILGITKELTFGRDPPRPGTLGPQQHAKSYFSYGRIVYRPGFYTLKGRIHLDMANSFLYGESGLRGLLDISRCSNIPLQLTSRLGPGTAISQIQVNTALAHGYLIPWKKNLPETWKTAEELLIADRGGLILEPQVGFHEQVIELDYASLYPNIMLRHNISPETLLCSCCPDTPHRVPQLRYHICARQKGLIPQVLEPILHRRFCYKSRARNPKYDSAVYQELQQAWKWVLLVCFGYTGYRNARYGRIECHESITAFSRDVILTAMDVAQQLGYQVIHGIIDSLWVQPTTAATSPIHLSRRISEQTGIRMDVEGRYRWIVFLPSKNTGVGALTRYYGVFDDGTLRIRGVEFRQRNTPPFLKTMQQHMIQCLSYATTATEFHAAIPQVLTIAYTAAKTIRDNAVPPSELLYTTNVTKEVTEYQVNTLVKAALLQLRDLDLQPQLGQSVRYIVSVDTEQNYHTRVCIAEHLTAQTPLDVDYYCRQIARLTESILIPFGYTKEIMEARLNGKTITRNSDQSLLL
ncbi:MAG: hypothetical protein KKG04_09180 [Candidatus Thermoplasmatota archaeon]|nr:hypothetical protein [Candidatus Thermoplasmatota archaeon]